MKNDLKLLSEAVDLLQSGDYSRSLKKLLQQYPFREAFAHSVDCWTRIRVESFFSQLFQNRLNYRR